MKKLRGFFIYFADGLVLDILSFAIALMAEFPSSGNSFYTCLRQVKYGLYQPIYV